MRPREALLKVLYENDVRSLASLACDLNRRFLRDPFQETAVHMLVKNSKINTEKGLKSKRWFKATYKDEEIWYMWRGGEERSDATHEREGKLTREELLPLLDEKPYIGVYLGFAHLHTERELRKLRLQLWEVLDSVRYFLWDAHMVMIDRPSWLDWKPNEYVKEMELKEFEDVNERIVLLDPNAENVLTREDVLEADAFVVGGIIDKEVPRPGLTSKIPCKRCERRKIELWGSVIGVPLTINKLVFAVLMARYELNGDIERALVEVMGARERRWRLAWEAVQAYRRGEDPVERVLQVAAKLKAKRSEVIRALRMSGIEGGKLAERLQTVHSSEDGHKDG